MTLPRASGDRDRASVLVAQAEVARGLARRDEPIRAGSGRMSGGGEQTAETAEDQAEERRERQAPGGVPVGPVSVLAVVGRSGKCGFGRVLARFRWITEQRTQCVRRISRIRGNLSATGRTCERPLSGRRSHIGEYAFADV